MCFGLDASAQVDQSVNWVLPCFDQTLDAGDVSGLTASGCGAVAEHVATSEACPTRKGGVELNVYVGLVKCLHCEVFKSKVSGLLSCCDLRV